MVKKEAPKDALEIKAFYNNMRCLEIHFIGPYVGYIAVAMYSWP